MGSWSQKRNCKPLKKRVMRLKSYLIYISCHNFSKFSQIASGQTDTDVKQQPLYWLNLDLCCKTEIRIWPHVWRMLWSYISFLVLQNWNLPKSLWLSHLSACCPCRAELFIQQEQLDFTPIFPLPGGHHTSPRSRKEALIWVCIVLTFNFISLTLKLVQALGRQCSASASNPDTLAVRKEEEDGLFCSLAKGSSGLQEAFGALWVLCLGKRARWRGNLGKLQVWGESNLKFVFVNLMSKLARELLLYLCLDMRFGDSSETAKNIKKKKPANSCKLKALHFTQLYLKVTLEGPSCRVVTKNSILYILVLKRLRKKM